MKKNNLQVGDHVMWCGGVCRVAQATSWVVGGDEGDDTYVLKNGEVDDFAPIPLSHAWLSENFVKGEYRDVVRDILHVTYSLLVGDSVVSLDYNMEDNTCEFELNSPNVHIEMNDMKYVHQLEHILREYDINVELIF